MFNTITPESGRMERSIKQKVPRAIQSTCLSFIAYTLITKSVSSQMVFDQVGLTVSAHFFSN